ncbi:DoxX family protein [Peterkaempfera sp. SMS 1(5)a]|uniref:DoxX family protein n=1 Tax=Peterkaempfera podocarpi TaxID=3232308 RepID=UPI00366BD089
MFIATAALSVLLALAFAGGGSGKVSGNPKLLEGAAHLGYSAEAYRRIGALELAGAAGLLIGLWWAPLGVAAGVGLVLLMGGAAISHARAKDAAAAIAPSVALGILAVVTVVLRIATA